MHWKNVLSLLNTLFYVCQWVCFYTDCLCLYWLFIIDYLLLSRLLLAYLLSDRYWDGEGDGTPLQCSFLENPMDGGTWWAAVHGVTKSRKPLTDFTFTFQFHALEKEMATHSSVIAWRIPGTEEPGGLPSMGSHRVGHDWSNLAAAAAVTGKYVKITSYGCALVYFSE